MVVHYLAAALAKFGKAPFTTAANVLMLALGLVCFIAAYGVASYWGAADDYHPNADRIFAVNQRTTAVGSTPAARVNVPLSSALLAPYLGEDFAELGPIVRASDERSIAVVAGEREATMFSTSVDPAFSTLFDLQFVAGDPGTALEGPNSVVLTQEAAARLFGDQPALGQSVLVNGSQSLTVTGVIKPVRQPSFMGSRADAVLRFDILTPWFANPELETDANWGSLAAFTFVTLPPTLSREAFDKRLEDFAARRVPADVRAVTTISYTATPLRDVAVSSVESEVLGRSGLDISLGAVFMALGLMTLLVACVNYANLATAQAAGRAKEFGMRKVIGAGRGHIMTQAWIEAGALTLLALGAAMATLALAAPVIASVTGIDMLHFLSEGATPALVLTGLAVAVTLAAGAYPALVLSGVRPSEALQSGQSRSGPRFVARILVGVQFASASFLLILVTVGQLQRAHLEDVAFAAREDPIMTLPRLAGLDIDYETFRTRMLAQPGVESMTVSDFAPWSRAFNAIDLARSPEAGAGRPFAFAKHVGYDYFETLNVRLLAGRTFEQGRDPKVNLFRTDASETPSVVIDDAYARSLGFASPAAAVGQIVYAPSDSIARGGAPAQPFRIIGVTEVGTTRLNASDKEGGVYAYNPDDFNEFPIIRLDRTDVASSVAAVRTVWDEFAPDVPADLRFFDELFEASYAAHARVNQIFALLAGAAFIIASVGLLGMTVHVASRRRHEIGVRKTLGSTTRGIIRLLLIDFSKPVLVANLLAWPLGYFAAQAYLAGFADRIALTPAPFALSTTITLAIAWAAIVCEVLKAAAVRPAEVLRQA
jgi:putative ABC transport system permease protein